jgi:hypothetical protein
LLKLFITVISQSIYNGTTKYLSDLNPFLAYATNNKFPSVKNIFFSLINTFLSIDKKKGLKNLGSLFTANMNTDELSENCGQLINILVNYSPPTLSNVQDLLNKKGALYCIVDHIVKRDGKQGNDELIKSFSVNEFERLLITIEGKVWFDSIFDKICNQLKKIYEISFYGSDFKEYNGIYELLNLMFKLNISCPVCQ